MRAAGRPDRAAARRLAGEVIAELAAGGERIPHVERVQDAVEKAIYRSGDFDLLKTYMLYRKKHEEIRQSKELFSNLDVIDDYLGLDDWRVKESANSSCSAPGAQPAHIDEHHFAVLARQTLYGRDSPGPSFRCAAHSRPRLSECLLRGLGPARPASGRLQGGGR